jgi:renalase
MPSSASTCPTVCLDGRARKTVAVVGAGLAGLTCAQRLAQAGYTVRVFEKSRGVGGRMATRRLQWQDDSGQAHTASVDHGTASFTARSPAFSGFVADAAEAGLLAPWSPQKAMGSFESLDGPNAWVATPDMPALCRHLALAAAWVGQARVAALHHKSSGWEVIGDEGPLGEGFDHVLLAIPPAQAAELVRPHRSDWAELAARWPMRPCWTLMAVVDQGGGENGGGPSWNLALPTRGPLASIIRNDAKPGRTSDPLRATWVAHATAAWSQTQLDSPAPGVEAQLKAAVAQWLGQPLVWRHTTVHRWLYASASRAETALVNRFWLDAGLGLGMCGDFLGGAGVEGAWTSGRALADALIGVTAE